MAFMGLKYAVFAQIEKETPGSMPTYAPGGVLGKMISANVNWTRNSNPLYEDDDIGEDDNSITGGTVSVNVGDIEEEMLVMACGLKKHGEGDDVTYVEVGEAGKPGGIGYLRVRRKGGVTSYVGYWIYKTLLGIVSESASTKGEQITWQTPTAEGKVMGVAIDDTGVAAYRERKVFANEAAARAWLNTRAGITEAAA